MAENPGIKRGMIPHPRGGWELGLDESLDEGRGVKCCVPKDDSAPHIEFSETCPCNPFVVRDMAGRRCVIHNAFDQREVLEEADRILAAAAQAQP